MAAATNSNADRDPEAEAEDKVEEEKLPGVDEEGAAAIESGFQTAGADDWSAAPAGFTGAAGGNWDGANDEWGATNTAAPAAAAGAEWGGEATKETSQW